MLIGALAALAAALCWTLASSLWRRLPTSLSGAELNLLKNWLALAMLLPLVLGRPWPAAHGPLLLFIIDDGMHHRIWPDGEFPGSGRPGQGTAHRAEIPAERASPHAKVTVQALCTPLVDVHLLRHEPAAPTSDTAERLDTTIPDGSRRSGLQRSKPTLLPGTSYAEYIPHGIEAWAFVSCPRCRSKCADSENCSIFRNVTQLDSLVRTGEHYFVVTHNSAPTQTCEFDLSQLPRRRPARQGTDYVLPNQGPPLCRRRS